MDTDLIQDVIDAIAIILTYKNVVQVFVDSSNTEVKMLGYNDMGIVGDLRKSSYNKIYNNVFTNLVLAKDIKYLYINGLTYPILFKDCVHL